MKFKSGFLFTIFLISMIYQTGFAKHKIMIIPDDDGEYFSGIVQFIKSEFIKRGFTEDSTDYIILSLKGKLHEGSQRVQYVISQAKKIKPDLVMINTTLIEPVAIPLIGSGIPVITGGGMELRDKNNNYVLVDENDNPKYNITGTYTMPTDHLSNSFKMLNRIAPVGNKKAVFITVKSGAFSEVIIKNNLSEMDIDLHAYHEIFYIDDYKTLINKYNKNRNIGWILLGELPVARKDGKESSRDDFFTWNRLNNKKPSVSYWETMVSQGLLCALAIDSLTTAYQMLDMGFEILNGADYMKVKAQNPKRIFIILNKKRADDLNLRFPLDILDSAWKVYTDYNGTYIGRKGEFN